MSYDYETILDRANHLEYQKNIPDADFILESANFSCGDEVKLMIKLNSDKIITEASHLNRSCAICNIASDILIEKIAGKHINEARNINLEEILTSLDFPLSPTRQKCAELPLIAFKKMP